MNRRVKQGCGCVAVLALVSVVLSIALPEFGDLEQLKPSDPEELGVRPEPEPEKPKKPKKDALALTWARLTKDEQERWWLEFSFNRELPWKTYCYEIEIFCRSGFHVSDTNILSSASGLSEHGPVFRKSVLGTFYKGRMGLNSWVEDPKKTREIVAREVVPSNIETVIIKVSQNDSGFYDEKKKVVERRFNGF